MLEEAAVPRDKKRQFCSDTQWRTEEGGLGCSKPSPPRKILKALQNRAKLNPIVETVKKS